MEVMINLKMTELFPIRLTNNIDEEEDDGDDEDDDDDSGRQLNDQLLLQQHCVRCRVKQETEIEVRCCWS